MSIAPGLENQRYGQPAGLDRIRVQLHAACQRARFNIMNILFVHNNFPAQFRNLAASLGRDPEMNVAAIGSNTAMPMPGVRLIKYALAEVDVADTHPFARRFDVECRRAEQVLYGLSTLSASGFKPDIIFAHPGWGETLPLRTMFPQARLLIYCEYYYGVEGRDHGFDPEFPATGLDGHIALQLKNATTLLALEDCDLGISPTRWQRSTFPAHYQSKIEIVHEGINVDIAKPDSSAVLDLPSGRQLTCSDEVVTFVVRNLEPVRGYHIFMRALPGILARRPNAEIVIVGGDGTSYGAAPPEGTSWKSIFFDEVKARIDLRRVHFLGRVPYHTYMKALQISSAHVYLTYPFVLSWSVLEAMSAGCVVIGSDTPPVQEIIDGKNGILVPFFNVEQWIDRVVYVLEHRASFRPMRDAARRFVKANFDADKICVPKMLSLLRGDGLIVPAPPAKGFWPGKKRQPSDVSSGPVRGSKTTRK
jgi:glycosyltransferase involved in cell wall biosynthesis